MIWCFVMIGFDAWVAWYRESRAFSLLFFWWTSASFTSSGTCDLFTQDTINFRYSYFENISDHLQQLSIRTKIDFISTCGLVKNENEKDLIQGYSTTTLFSGFRLVASLNVRYSLRGLRSLSHLYEQFIIDVMQLVATDSWDWRFLKK